MELFFTFQNIEMETSPLHGKPRNKILGIPPGKRIVFVRNTKQNTKVQRSNAINQFCNYSMLPQLVAKQVCESLLNSKESKHVLHHITSCISTAEEPWNHLESSTGWWFKAFPNIFVNGDWRQGLVGKKSGYDMSTTQLTSLPSPRVRLNRKSFPPLFASRWAIAIGPAAWAKLVAFAARAIAGFIKTMPWEAKKNLWNA